MSTGLAKALQKCADEPIHIPGSIQPHGVLLALSQEMVVRQVSDNTGSVLSQEPDVILEKSLAEIIGKEQSQIVGRLIDQSAQQENTQTETISLDIDGSFHEFDAIIHHTTNLIILELEPVTEEAQDLSFKVMHGRLGSFATRLQIARTSNEQAQITAEEVRKLTGFGRIKVYQFDEGWNGRVVAESKEERMESYMGQYFPASDIPEQARALYTKNPIRLIADVNYEPTRLITAEKGAKPLDLSFSVLRSVSHIHLQYLHNMGVASSMSISILQDGKLWGLICCHDDQPRYVSYQVKIIAELMANIVALQLSVLSNAQDLSHKEKLQRRISQVTALLRNQSAPQDIDSFLPEIMGALDASGFVLKLGNRLHISGIVPEGGALEEIIKLAQDKLQSGIFSTDKLGALLKLDEETAAISSGLLASSISPDEPMIWLRPEIVQKLKWAGNPYVEKDVDEQSQTLTPRSSFAIWEETVKSKAQPWSETEIEAAQYLADSVHMHQIDGALKRSNEQLERFAYLTSHDLQEPLRTVARFTDLLSEEYQNKKLDAQAVEYMDYITDGAQRMQNMVRDLLEYSRIGHEEGSFTEVDGKAHVEIALANLKDSIDKTKAVIIIEELPIIQANPACFTSLLQNLIGNALKYCSEDRVPEIEITVEDRDGKWCFAVHDNGIGIKNEYLEQIFDTFKRLHSKSEYSGTGIGLAVCRKIVEEFGGRIWAKSEPNKGSVFYFTAPKIEKCQESRIS